MDTPAPSSRKALRLVDVHRAIETLSIAQAQIGIAVVSLLEEQKASRPDTAALQALIDNVDTSVSQLQKLALDIMDIPYDS